MTEQQKAIEEEARDREEAETETQMSVEEQEDNPLNLSLQTHMSETSSILKTSSSWIGLPSPSSTPKKLTFSQESERCECGEESWKHCKLCHATVCNKCSVHDPQEDNELRRYHPRCLKQKLSSQQSTPVNSGDDAGAMGAPAPRKLFTEVRFNFSNSSILSSSKFYSFQHLVLFFPTFQFHSFLIPYSCTVFSLC